MIMTFLRKFFMEFFRLKVFFISQDTSLLQRSNVAGLITAELKFIFLNKFKSFRTPYVSLSVPGFQKSGKELEKNNRIKKDLCFVYIQLGSHVV